VAEYTVIKKLKANGSGGPDGFLLLLFKNLASYLSEPLSLMFTCFMFIGQIPQGRKHALVTPVYKNWSPSNVANNRFLSLTCVSRRGFAIVTPHIRRAMNSSPRLNCTIQCVCGETTVFTARQKQLMLTESQPTTTQTNNKRQYNKLINLQVLWDKQKATRVIYKQEANSLTIRSIIGFVIIRKVLLNNNTGVESK